MELLEERLNKLGIKDSYALQIDPNFHNPTELTPEQGMFLKVRFLGFICLTRHINRKFDSDIVYSDLIIHISNFQLAIAGAFYPNYFLRRRPELRQYEREMNKEVNGNDVLRTVYFKGFPQDHNGDL